jgi:hypothetical protein
MHGSYLSITGKRYWWNFEFAQRERIKFLRPTFCILQLSINAASCQINFCKYTGTESFIRNNIIRKKDGKKIGLSKKRAFGELKFLVKKLWKIWDKEHAKIA